MRRPKIAVASAMAVVLAAAAVGPATAQEESREISWLFSRPTDGPVIDPEPEKPAPAPVRSLKVLLVDDNEINLLVAQSMLESLGHRVTSAHDGHSALIEVRRTRFDAILMDCQMPGMDGYEATRIIREEETARGEATRVPIIALTANALSGAQEECLAAGMDDYLLKPVGLDPLRDALIRAVESELDATS